MATGKRSPTPLPLKQANILSFKVGKGNVVTYGSQIDFRAQPRATWKLIFNGIFHGPATPVAAAQMGKGANAATNEPAFAKAPAGKTR